MIRKLLFPILLLLSIYPTLMNAQGYLHTENGYIYDKDSSEVIIRSIGTGNWMLQEGYMMKTSEVANTQHEFRQKLIETIGVEKTDSFYNAWLAYHFTRTDVDSMKSWGFNTVRVAMHYKWLTPPIEDEPVPGEITWIDKGFIMIDSLLDWCSDNEMYLILDLHGAPGGQGYDEAISDYDPTKPSLWESQENKNKTIALWKKLAERYSTEEWIGGYDLINEPNWNLGSNNAALWELYKDITAAIREVDQNHIIIIEGNWFANNYDGVPARWDDNIVYSFHKYWSYTTTESIQYAINLRNQHNVAIWLGESGENSNTWFTNMIRVCEDNRIGWSWWPVKKVDINNVLEVKANQDYYDLIDYWNGDAAAPTVDEAFEALLTFAENHKIENCVWQRDVVDAMIRQVYSYETLPFASHKPGDNIYFSDYDYGRNNFAYFDTDTANYHLDQNGNYTSWNVGGQYRNNGVDIQVCEDSVSTNGYNVGWTEAGEWMAYTIESDSAAFYTLSIRYASGNPAGGIVRFLSDGIPITGNIHLPVTGDWQNWQNWASVEIDTIILSGGLQKITLENITEGANLNYFKFTDPQDVSKASFQKLAAETNEKGTIVRLHLNMDVISDISSTSPTEFEITADANTVSIDSITMDSESDRTLVFHLTDSIAYGELLLISYSGASVMSEFGMLQNFNDFVIKNNKPVRHTLPGLIQAEDFYFNNGLELEECTDEGNGLNTGFTNPGDYVDYLVYMPEAGLYSINFRVATERSDARIILMTNHSGAFVPVETVSFEATGGWQEWTTQSSSLNLPEGRYTFRIYIQAGEHNLNWFEITDYDAVNFTDMDSGLKIFPNPAVDFVSIQTAYSNSSKSVLYVYDSKGRLMESVVYNDGENTIQLNTSNYYSGYYSVILVSDETVARGRFIVF